MSELRSDPDALLSRLKKEEFKSKRGRLKIFFGAIAGVGKTYSMLDAAKRLKEQNIDVIVGYVETHGRQETDRLLEGLEILPAKVFEYKGAQLKELDIDAAITRKPKIIIVDELAHTNAPGSRHTKRWQDVQELLEAGIDVFTTLNVQHVESLHDVIAQITKVSIKERVPDSLLENANEIELIDLPPDELIERMKAGKVYVTEQARTAMENFFRKGNLIALRELALRYTAERVVDEMEQYRQDNDIKQPWPASEHILVCVSLSPLATRLVRAGKRMAEALHAHWTVLYVEGTRQIPLTIVQKDRLNQMLRLAEQLGAQTLELSGNDIPEEIIKCANQYNISKIIIGKPARVRWKEIILGSVVDDVIRRSGIIDVYVITGDEAAPLPASKRKMETSVQAYAYIRAVLVVIVCTALAKLMLPHFEPANIVMAYLLGIVLVAARYGRGPSILASILSVITFDFFFIPPYYTFAVSDTQYFITFAVMLVVSFVISTLTVTTKQQAQAARLKEMRTAALYSMSKELASTLDIDSLVTIGLRHIGNIFDSRTALFLEKNNKLDLTAKGEGEHALVDVDFGIAAWVNQNKQSAGLGTDTLPGASGLYLPLLGADKNIGVLALRPAQEDRFQSPEQLRLLENFANQIALACERAELSKENEQAHLQVKTEQLRNALLSSVSSTLRTPLATITSTANTILAGTDTIDLSTCKIMVKDIYDQSLRLNRVVSNLLDMTKIQAGTLDVMPESHTVAEIIEKALAYMQYRIGNHTIKSQIPGDLPLISVDTALIHQVLVNLIENAAKYSPCETEIEISAYATDQMVTIAVADRGPGIKQEYRRKIFEKFYRGQPDTPGGAGLGLAICHGFVEAHKGRIWVEDRPDGGAIFKFTVPIANKLAIPNS